MKAGNSCCLQRGNLPTQHRTPPTRKKLKNGWIRVAVAPAIPIPTGTSFIHQTTLFYPKSRRSVSFRSCFLLSSIPEWESSIDESTGELLYIDCLPHVTQNTTESSPKSTTAFVKSPARQSTRSKFLRLIRRRESKRRSKHWQSGQIGVDNVTSKVKFQVSARQKSERASNDLFVLGVSGGRRKGSEREAET